VSIRQSIGVVAGILLGVIVLTPRAQAQAINQSTQVTLRTAIRVPGHVLPAGSYIFERANHGDGPNVNLIQIYNEDHTRLIATVQTVTTERLSTSGETVMKFAEGSNGQPPALLAWFYPGMQDGYGFIYSRKTEQKLEASKADFVASNSNGARLVKDESGD
jgi:hypothetical protein